MKSSVDEIRQRFDADVERFSNLETGQSSTIDAPLSLELIVRAAAATTPRATHLLDVGAGAGNYTLRMLRELPGLDVTLVDLSRPMLDRAAERLRESSATRVHCVQADVRELELGEARFDLITAAAVLHHLRTTEEWEAVFTAFFRALRPGGSLWISDLVEHSIPAVQALLWERYGEYLSGLRDEAYRDHVFAYVAREDSPRPLAFQLELLRRVGFDAVDVLHKHSVFAAFGAVKRA
ncbi:MAG TPA: class I SAM-dependent methyltransferase [Gemmatimonadaceae bacterium]|jgi:tRNA (cmo5U34)-methyltransferase|nr:class I SAM-dependent methyltransferase [Gemmatimonadaceae bacterium]